MIINILKLSRLLYYLFLIMLFTNSVEAKTNNYKESIIREKNYFSRQTYNLYQKSLNNLDLTEEKSLQFLSNKFISYIDKGIIKVILRPISSIELIVSYNRISKKINDITLRSKQLESEDKKLMHQLIVMISMSMLDQGLNRAEAEDMYNQFDINNNATKNQYVQTINRNDYLHTISVNYATNKTFSIVSKLNTPKETEDQDIASYVSTLYYDTMSQLTEFIDENIYPQVVNSLVKRKTLLVNVSPKISFEININIDTKEIHHITLASKSRLSLPEDIETYNRVALAIVRMISPDLSVIEVRSLIDEMGIDKGINDSKYNYVTTNKNLVYDIYTNRGSLVFKIHVKEDNYDQKEQEKNRFLELYNKYVTDLGLPEYDSIQKKEIDVTIYKEQISLSFNPTPYMIFRMYIDTLHNEIVRTSVIMSKNYLSQNITARNNTLIAMKFMDPLLSREKIENILNDLRTLEEGEDIKTVILNNIRYKVCLYNEETFIFAKVTNMNKTESTVLNSTSKPTNNIPSNPTSKKNSKKISFCI